jgi:hypothetical protein
LKQPLIACRKRIYDEFIEIETMDINGTSVELIEPSVIKLNLMFENQLNFTNYFEYDSTFITNRRHLENMDDFSFVHFAHFQTSLIKSSFHILTKLIREDRTVSFPVTLEGVLELAAELRENLLKFLTMIDFAECISDAYIVILCIFELHHALFLRPLLYDNDKRALFVQQPRLNQEDFKSIIKAIEVSILNYDQNSSWQSLEKCDVDYVNRMIEALTEFVRNYSHQLNYSVTFRLIYHQTNEKLQESLQNLLCALIRKPKFADMLGLTIMKYVKCEDSLMDYASFFVTPINRFILEEKKTYLHFETALFVVKLLPEFFKKLDTGINRLHILQHILLFIPKVLKRCESLTLEKLVEQAVEGLELTKEEKDILDFFAADIKAKELRQSSNLNKISEKLN